MQKTFNAKAQRRKDAQVLRTGAGRLERHRSLGAREVERVVTVGRASVVYGASGQQPTPGSGGINFASLPLGALALNSD
jgi:hypothetical protein